MLRSIVKDLYSRFIRSLPESEKLNTVRMMVHIQQAYWFFVDYIEPLQNGGNAAAGTDHKMGLTRFVHHMVPFLGWSHKDVRLAVREFWKYSAQIPRCGGVLVNTRKTKVLLVRGFGSKRWGFPVGKMDDNESVSTCAEREVFEETGFKGKVLESAEQLVYRKRKAVHTLFVFANIPDDYDFTPQTRKEIEEIKWFPIDTLGDVLEPNIFRAFIRFRSRMPVLQGADFLKTCRDEPTTTMTSPLSTSSASSSSSEESEPLPPLDRYPWQPPIVPGCV